MSENTTNNNRPLAIALLGLGAFFLVTQIFNISWISILWPLFVILPGVPFLYAAWNGGEKQAGLIFPGLLVSGTGLILLYQSLTGHFESWAYLWALYPVLIGVGLRFLGQRTGDQGSTNTGRGMVRFGLMALAGFAFFFEFLIFGSIFTGLSGTLLTLAFLGGGAYMLLRRGLPDVGGRVRDMTRREDPKPKHKYEGPSPEIDPDLQRKINEALAEDQPANGKVHDE